jgi:alkylated DNA repair protein (DNA oxidative demethylase)
MPFFTSSIDRTKTPGFSHYPAFLDLESQHAILRRIEEALPNAPLLTPVMPRTGRPFSVRMTNFGSLGWVSDRKGYRYQPTHPQTGSPWPRIPEEILRIWRTVSNYPIDPECCLVNYYAEGAKMGLHRDEDEDELEAPVTSISLGDTAIFRLGGLERTGKTGTLKLLSGDVMVMAGASRLRYHGVDRILTRTSRLLPMGGRINLTLRRVTKPS